MLGPKLVQLAIDEVRVVEQRRKIVKEDTRAMWIEEKDPLSLRLEITCSCVSRPQKGVYRLKVVGKLSFKKESV